MRVLILAFCLFLLHGCKQIDKLTEFNLYYSKTVVVPSSSIINLPINLPTPDFTTNSETSFAIHSTSSDLVESIYLNELNLTITNPSSGNFNFLKSASIFISSPTQPEVKIAWKDSITSLNSSTLSLDISGLNLDTYLKSDSIKLKLSTITDELITSDYTIDIHAGFLVRAKLITK